MKSIPNPLRQPTKGPEPRRILSDRGIVEAIGQGLLRSTPSIDLSENSRRVQPASLDVTFNRIVEAEDLGDKGMLGNQNLQRGFPAEALTTFELSELIDFGQLRQGFGPLFLGVSSEARSSLRTLGCYIPHPGYFFSGPEQSTLEIANFSKNSIAIEQGERVAQLFLQVFPFQDIRYSGNGRKSERGELIRSLEMGVNIHSKTQIRALEQQGYLEVFPRLNFQQHSLLVHASSKAYRLKEIDGGISFSERKNYSFSDLWEKIDISGGVEIRPFDHIFIETVESFSLSEHVGIRFWDNIPHSFNPLQRHMKNVPDLFENVGLISLTDGWVDPGYRGGFSRQPKWMTRRVIYPGDVVGMGEVFFFPNGVQNPYGSRERGSQYQESRNRLTEQVG